MWFGSSLGEVVEFAGEDFLKIAVNVKVLKKEIPRLQQVWNPHAYAWGWARGVIGTLSDVAEILAEVRLAAVVLKERFRCKHVIT